MANPTAAGIGTYDKELLDAIKVQAQLMVDPIKGFESRTVLSQFLQAVTLTDEDPGINLTKLSQGRVVSRIPKGGPYPRVFSDVTSFFLQPVKIGGRYDNYLEDLLGVSTNVRAAMTAGTFEKLRDDLALTIDELVALAFNAAPTAKDIYDGSASNACTAFSMSHLDKMILKLKQKTGVRTVEVGDLLMFSASAAGKFTKRTYATLDTVYGHANVEAEVLKQVIQANQFSPYLL